METKIFCKYQSTSKSLKKADGYIPTEKDDTHDEEEDEDNEDVKVISLAIKKSV